VLETTPAIPRELLDFIRWTADYYQFPLGETCQNILPTLVRQGAALETTTPKTSRAICLTVEGQGLPEGALKRAPKQAEVIAQLQQHSAISLEQCREQGVSSEVVRQLKNKQLIKECELAPPTPSLEAPLPLLREQQIA